MWGGQFNKFLVHLFWPKYTFCGNFNEIGPVDLALALGPHNIHTDKQTCLCSTDLNTNISTGNSTSNFCDHNTLYLLYFLR